MSNKWKWLQFFADGASGGDGGEGAGTGVNSADAGQSTGVMSDDAGQRMEKLGIPKDMADRYKRSRERRGANTPADSTAQAEEPAAEKPAKETKRDPQKEFDDFMADPEHQSIFQSHMAARGKKATEAKDLAEATVQQYEPLMALFEKHYNIPAKDGKRDVAAIIEAVTGDDYFFEDEALSRGESVEKVKSDWQAERENAQRQAEERQRALSERFFSMQQDEPDIQKDYPGFDWEAEKRDPLFSVLTFPKEYGGFGLTARQAYRMKHVDDIEKSTVEAVAERAKADAARAKQANMSRPRENGSKTAPTSFNTMPDFKKMGLDESRKYIMAKYGKPR